MNTINFSIGDIVNESWSIIKKNVWIFAGVILGFYLIIFLIASLFGGLGSISASATGDIQSMLGAMFGLSALIYMVLILVLSAAFSSGYYKMALMAADGEEPTMAAFSFSLKKVLNILGAIFLFVIVFYIGFFLCIIPGLIVIGRLCLFPFFIIDKDCNAIEALTKSWDATNGQTVNMLLLILAYILINFLGMLCCGIGILVTGPMEVIGLALVYRKLTGIIPQDVDFEALSESSSI